MISPSYSLTATERVLPRMALDFTTAILDSRVTFTRSGNTATVTNSSGIIVGINADLPRFDFDPTTLICKGLLIEESRTNALLNSLVDGTSLATQLVTVTAAARTFSFYGTGTVVLSGAHSATVVGTGAYPTRTTLTFTPSAGVLTLTVTGTVQFAQLETGAFATSFIPTAATAVTRNADIATMTGTNFSDWYNATEGALLAQAAVYGLVGGGNRVFTVSDGTNNNIIQLYQASSLKFGPLVSVVGATQFNAVIGNNLIVNEPTKNIISVKENNFVATASGAVVVTDNTGTVPTVNRLNFGATGAGVVSFNGHIQKFMYWPQRLTNNEVQAFSK